METFCYQLNIFNLLKKSFFIAAFINNSPECRNLTLPAERQATQLHIFPESNPSFIKLVQKGCRMGDPDSACQIGTSKVNDIFMKFSQSYYSYLKDPVVLCSAFSEYANDVDDIFITAGCYLNGLNNTSLNNTSLNETSTICNRVVNNLVDKGYKCNN